MGGRRDFLIGVASMAAAGETIVVATPTTIAFR
jgi:hypothetical protein